MTNDLLFPNKNDLFRGQMPAGSFAFKEGDIVAFSRPIWDNSGFYNGQKLRTGTEQIRGRVLKMPRKYAPNARITINYFGQPKNFEYSTIIKNGFTLGDADTLSPGVEFVNELKKNIEQLTSKQVTKLAEKYGINDDTVIKELYETALLLYVKSLNLDSSLKSFNRVVEIYNKQITLSLRTSQSIMLQQYSTPIPLSWLAGVFVRHNQPSMAKYFEPSAGNGLLTIALPEELTIVNELDNNRRNNLEQFHNYLIVTNQDGSKPFFRRNEIDGVVTNPPFGAVPAQTYGGYKINKLEHVMAITALDTLKDSGRAAIIIGGHTEWDEYKRVKNGANRFFLSYLYHFYNVEDVINIRGDMYAKQGTRVPIRLILINGRKATPAGTAPNKTAHDSTVQNWDELYARVDLATIDLVLPEKSKKGTIAPKETPLTAAEQAMVEEIMQMEKEMELGGIFVPHNMIKEMQTISESMTAEEKAQFLKLMITKGALLGLTDIDIPKGNKQIDIKNREKLIIKYYKDWERKNPKKRVFNIDLGEYIYVNSEGMNETMHHAGRSYKSTLYFLNIDLTELLKKSFVVAEDKPHSKKQEKAFAKMLLMQWEDSKLTVGITKTEKKKIQYSVSAIK
jgi:hypothetical protein